jgi:acid phosphatase type 7
MAARVQPSSSLLVAAAAVAVAALMAMAVAAADSTTDNIQPLSTLRMQAAQVAMDSGAVIHASPDVLGKNVSKRV